MTCVDVDLCSIILEDHFGYYVSIVGKFLLSNQNPLAFIIKNIEPKLKPKEVCTKNFVNNNKKKFNFFNFRLKDH